MLQQLSTALGTGLYITYVMLGPYDRDLQSTRHPNQSDHRRTGQRRATQYLHIKYSNELFVYVPTDKSTMQQLSRALGKVLYKPYVMLGLYDRDLQSTKHPN